jgi:hypothetical protein
VGDVRNKIHGEADGDDKGVAGDHIDREAPEMHHAGNLGRRGRRRREKENEKNAGHLYDSSSDTEDDEESSPEAAKEDAGGEEDGEQGGADVAVELPLDHLVSHPVGVPEEEEEEYEGEMRRSEQHEDEEERGVGGHRGEQLGNPSLLLLLQDLLLQLHHLKLSVGNPRAPQPGPSRLQCKVLWSSAPISAAGLFFCNDATQGTISICKAWGVTQGVCSSTLQLGGRFFSEQIFNTMSSTILVKCFF